MTRLSRHELAAVQLKQAQVKAKKKELVDGLPFLYGHKWYGWQRAFFESRNKMCLLTAANQIGKSTVQMWKVIHWATEQKLWRELWTDKPNLFWYLYPSTDIVSREFRLKWKRWLPQGAYKDCPVFGWKVDGTRNEREINGIEFNSGVLMEFKTYNQNVHDLQAGTVFYMAADEELPEDLWDELDQRLSDTKGYFSAVFTATRGQQMWHRAMEGKDDVELFPEAHKQQVSKYDCITFDDGSPGRYTEKEVRAQEARCRNKAQALVRIHGKFGAEEGRKYHAFDPTRHFMQPKKIPDDWKRYSGVDIGSGGQHSHPASTVFIAVRPDFRMAYAYKAWRGDGIETSAGDILDYYRLLRGSDVMTAEAYDWASKEFGIIATRSGEGFVPAEKGHTLGEETINTLFENDMLYLFDTPDMRKLGAEMMSLMKKTAKQKAKDDLADSFRYACTQVPWDWTCLVGAETEEQIKEKNKPRLLTADEMKKIEMDERRGIRRGPEQQDGWREWEAEIDEWNEAYGN